MSRLPAMTGRDDPTALERALKLHRQGRLEQAEAIYRQLLHANPGHSKALNLLGVVRLQRGEPEAAEELIRAALVRAQAAGEIHRIGSGIYNNLGEALRAQLRYQAALAAYQHALRLSADNTDALNNLAITYHLLNRFDDAKATFDLTLRVCPEDPETLMNYGGLLREFGYLHEAVHRYEQAIRFAPDFAPPYAGLGVALFEAGRNEDAVAALERATQLNPALVEAHENLCKVYWFLGAENMQYRSYERVCEAFPDRTEPLLNFAQALLATEESNRAEAVLKQVIHLDGAHSEAHHLMGRACRDQGRLGAAIASHERAVELSTPNANQLEDYGKSLVAAGRFEKAVPILEAACRKMPRRSSALGCLTLALSALSSPALERYVNYDKYVHVAFIDPPTGFEDLATFNRVLHEALKPFHESSSRPLDQTMRGGTQSRNNLFVTATRMDDSGAIKALEDAIRVKIDAFVAGLEADPSDPFLRFQNPDYVFTGAWSTILSQSGYDSSHIHNEGWLSGTYYVQAPVLDEAQRAQGEGHLQFGEPPQLFARAKNTTARTIAPQAGMVALFPSYYWHGVRQFSRGGIRHAVSFDVR